MAKKNSSKTATEKAISSSEPRTISFRSWQGVSYVDSPLEWDPLQSGPEMFRQTNLPQNFLMVQNNLNTSDTMAVETRQDSVVIGEAPEGLTFTGVGTVYKHWIFLVATDGTLERIVYRDLLSDDPSSFTAIDAYKNNSKVTAGLRFLEIGFYESNLVATAVNDENTLIAMDDDYTGTYGELFLAKVETGSDDSSISIKGMNWSSHTDSRNNAVVNTPQIYTASGDKPSVSPEIIVHGMEYSADGSNLDAPVRIEVKFCYTSRLGSSLTQDDADCATMYVELSPALWTTKKYVTIRPHDREASSPATVLNSIDGVDIYAREQENLDWVFVGHVDATRNKITAQAAADRWYYNWYGNMTDVTQWVTAQLMPPTENTSHGPDASYFYCIDSRMYFWGTPSKPYRLWIGGNPGAEFSVARGLGGGWVDIEPGSGYDVKGVCKWKTVQGSNIVTIMCGNRNTAKVKRFNLVETNLTFTNEVAYKSYMYEEVSNVVGCNSRWGFGVYDEGLYSLSRYGLMLTTMAMEYNAQMRNQEVSAPISPIFTERLGKRLRDGRMVCVNGIIYIALSEEEQEDEPIGLDNVMLCYNIGLKSWYTWTHDQTYSHGKGEDPDKIVHILPVDSDEFPEGLGAITESQVRLYPVTGIQETVVPEFDVLLETAELMPRMPMQAFWYVQQMELRFDYFVGDPDDPATVLIEGVDYYGRSFSIEKKLNIKSRGHHGKTGEQRNYIEWIRIDKIVESLRLRIKGHARFRLTHMNMKIYQQADTIGTPYGFDARDTYADRHGNDHVIHHYIDDYNNLRRAVIS